MNSNRIRVAAALAAVFAAGALAGADAAALADATKDAKARSIELTTASAEARAQAQECIRRIETFRGGPPALEAAEKAIAADPAFAVAYLLAGANAAPGAGKAFFEKADALAAKASEGERRYIAAAALNRAQKRAEALEALRALARDYPGDRMVQILLGQVATAENKLDEAAAAYDRALALDAATPRVHALRANVHTLQNQFPQARAEFQQALQRQVDGTAPGQIHLGLALTYVYEGNVDQALTTMRGYLERYRSVGGLPGLPEVFIWNAMARMNLENGRLKEALADYEKGFESVPGSAASERDKKLWLGRLHHGRGRTLAKMGKPEEAWKEAEFIKKMIDENGEEGKEFLPSWHYLAGYIKLEAGDGPAALEHLKQSNPNDPFHKMLLGRAYQATGDTATARKIYEEVVASTQVGLERALAYPEAKKRLASL